MPIRIGARGSQLSRRQTLWVAERLRQAGAETEVVWIETQGDVGSQPLSQIGGQGVFTKEIQRALLDGRADLAVHSLKDLPTAAIDGLKVAASPARESVADVLIAREPGVTFEQLPENATVGTGSARRRAQLLNIRPDLRPQEIRGNVDTRLRKLDDGDYDAIVLAEAGLNRLQLERARVPLGLDWMLPAVGQGALGLECRADDVEVQRWLQAINHNETLAAVTAERSMLARLQGGCLAPVAAWARTTQADMMRLEAAVLSLDGATRLTADGEAPLPDGDEALAAAAELGERVAEDLMEQGAERLLERE